MCHQGEKQEHPVSNTVQPLDDGALLLLQAAFKSLESFSHVSKDPKHTTGGQRWLPPPSSTVVESEIFDSLSESAVTQQYLATQEALQQTRTRMEVLEILLDKEKQNPKLGKFKSLEPYPLIPPQKVDEDSADSSDKLFENILSEINHLKVSAAERATPSHPLGYLLETNHRQVRFFFDGFSDHKIWFTVLLLHFSGSRSLHCICRCVCHPRGYAPTAGIAIQRERRDFDCYLKLLRKASEIGCQCGRKCDSIPKAAATVGEPDLELASTGREA